MVNLFCERLRLDQNHIIFNRVLNAGNLNNGTETILYFMGISPKEHLQFGPVCSYDMLNKTYGKYQTETHPNIQLTMRIRNAN